MIKMQISCSPVDKTVNLMFTTKGLLSTPDTCKQARTSAENYLYRFRSKHFLRIENSRLPYLRLHRIRSQSSREEF